MRTTLLLLLIGTLQDTTPTQKQQDVFEVVVTRQVITKVANEFTIVADSRDPKCDPSNTEPNCEHATLYIQLKNWKFADWPDSPAVGMVLKARWDANGELEPVASCVVRRHKNMAAWCEEAGYACWQVSANAFRPTDCTRPRSAFIDNLLSPVK